MVNYVMYWEGKSNEAYQGKFCRYQLPYMPEGPWSLYVFPARQLNPVSDLIRLVKSSADDSINKVAWHNTTLS